MIYEVKRVDIWSVVKIAFILCGIFGLLAGTADPRPFIVGMYGAPGTPRSWRSV